MTPELERSQNRRRALLLLAVYAFFVLVPAVHVLVHDHDGVPAAPAGPGGSPAFLVAACGDDCHDPAHAHRAHAAGPCVVCGALRSAIGLQPVPLAARVILAPQGLAAVALEECRSVPLVRGPSVRGPPSPPQLRGLETLVA